MAEKHMKLDLDCGTLFSWSVWRLTFYFRMAPEVILAMDEGQYDGKVRK